MKTLYCPGSALLSAIYVCLMSTIGLGDVPDEYVVYPALLDGRNSDPNRVLRIDDDIVLNLKPASVLTKDLSLRVLKDGLETEHIIDARIIQSNLYKDSAHGTSIVMREDSSGLEVKGIVNRHYAIRPSQLQDRSSVGPREHILFKLAEPDKGGTVEMEELIHLTARSERELPGGKKDSTPLPAEINPELHVVGDAKHVAGFRDVYKNTTKVAYIEYVCLLLNGVNLIFESMSQPRIHINLVGVTMIEDNNTDIFVMDGSYVRGRETLETKFRDFVAKKTRNTTDMVYLLTGHDVVGMHRGDVSIFANVCLEPLNEHCTKAMKSGLTLQRQVLAARKAPEAKLLKAGSATIQIILLLGRMDLVPTADLLQWRASWLNCWGQTSQLVKHTPMGQRAMTPLNFCSTTRRTTGSRTVLKLGCGKF
ncbi:uncharacterized protein LOC135385445 isoform X4 [Ornithodoros turicata]|uniref:uncharacterized protein LOC135385445 isoform X4 n=1 Tax=Ornithodoros turicata TaxID=34597 RepID=UPI003139F004